MRTLCKKALALCLVAALALTCFVGTLSVSAAESNSYDATITVADVVISTPAETATAVLNISIPEGKAGINEAIFDISSTIGSATDVKLNNFVVDAGTADVDPTQIDDENINYNRFALSAYQDEDATELNGITSATIEVTFAVETEAAGKYPITIDVSEVKAADKDEVVINLVYEKEAKFIIKCDEHTYGDVNEVTAPTCGAAGAGTQECSVCGDVKEVVIDATGKHSYTYAPAEAGKHSVDCPNCDTVFDAETCVDENQDKSCDKCNADLTEEEPECDHQNATKTVKEVTETKFIYDLDCPDCDEENLEIDVVSYTSSTEMKASIQPKNSIGIRFFMMDNDMTGYTDFTLVAVKEYYLKNDPTVRYQTYYQTNYFETDNSEYADRHEFVFEDVSAYEMNNDIEAKIFAKNAEGKMVCLYQRTISVAFYVKAVMPKSASPFAKTLVDLVVYGSKMQVYCGQNTANLVDSFLTETQRAWGTPESDYPTSFEEFNSLTNEQTTVEYLDNSTPLGSLELRRSLSAGSRINLYFTLRTIKLNSMDLSNVYCKYDYYADKNTQTSYIEAYSDKAEVHNQQYHAFLFDIAPASMLDYPVTATIYYGHPDDSNSVAVSTIMSNAESYIAALVKNNTSGAMMNALKAMWAFGHSLADYATVPPYFVQ